MAGTQDNGNVGFDIAAALGADAGISAQCFKVYVPNKDQKGEELGNQRAWVRELIRLLSELNGGATAMPPVEGAWMGDKGELVYENPVVVYSFVHPERFRENIARVREYLHRLGRETNQGEIAFEFGERFYRIRQFDAAEEKP